MRLRLPAPYLLVLVISGSLHGCATYNRISQKVDDLIPSADKQNLERWRRDQEERAGRAEAWRVAYEMEMCRTVWDDPVSGGMTVSRSLDSPPKVVIDALLELTPHLTVAVEPTCVGGADGFVWDVRSTAAFTQILGHARALIVAAEGGSVLQVKVAGDDRAWAADAAGALVTQVAALLTGAPTRGATSPQEETHELRSRLGTILLHSDADWWDDDHLVGSAESGAQAQLLQRRRIEDVPGYIVERCQVKLALTALQGWVFCEDVHRIG